MTKPIKSKIKDEERPVCSICGERMVYHLSITYYEEVGGWYLTCDCIDEYRIEPDEEFHFVP